MTTDRPVILHQGVYKKTATLAEAIFMITGLTIGAGILGLPYVVSRVGLAVGLVFILVLGAVMLLLNLMIGELAVSTTESLQIPGLAGIYLGGLARRVLSFMFVLSAYGALLAYTVGEGSSLALILGGEPLGWSIIFWAVGSIVVWRGLNTAKGVEKILGAAVIAIICGLSLFLLPKGQPANWAYFDFSKLFLPFGVILFALNGTGSIVEARALLPGRDRSLRRAIIIGTVIPILTYLIFTAASVGVGGLQTTEIATLGLGQRFGSPVLALGNIFAILAMGTGFIGLGIALKQTLVWDNKIKTRRANLLVISVPLILFLLGWRNFIEILNVVGGLFIGIEALVITAAYWRLKRIKSSGVPQNILVWLKIAPVILVFSFIVIVSIAQFF